MPISSPYIHTSRMAVSGKRQRAIVVVAPGGTIPERLRFGLERELPWAVLHEVDNVATACNTFPETVSLILLHPDAVQPAERSAPQIRRFHPLALIGLLQTDIADAGLQTREIVASSKILQGLVPLRSKAHEFVAIVSFMLRGGQYFPREMLSVEAQAPPPLLAREIIQLDGLQLTQLTRRELQILELVSRGLQNKTIAAQLYLSEFTVKIHLHNIITKLGAHNRTEAAAFFRDSQPTPLSRILG